MTKEDLMNELYIFKKAALDLAEERRNLVFAIKELANAKDHFCLLHREAFRWSLDGKVVNGAYSSAGMSEVLKYLNLQKITHINDDMAMVVEGKKEKSE